MATRQYDDTVPVLIVGGSLVGLSTALFLSGQGIRCLLVERHPGVSPFTRAGGFNQRTLELYRAFGVEPAIRQIEPKREGTVMILQVESLMGKELGSYTQKVSDFDSPVSPTQMSFITQDRLEPILHAHAEKLGGDLRFNTTVLSSEQDADGVTAIVRNNASGIELSNYRIGTGGDFIDVHGDFLSTYGLSGNGAVLVRPDGFIAWRSGAADEDLEQVFARLLSR